MDQEIRVTIEILTANGAVLDSIECLSGLTAGGAEAGFLGDIEAALDEMLEGHQDDDDDDE